MPLRGKDKEVERHFEREYGPEKGKRVFYGTLNKRINQKRGIKIPETKRLKAKRKKSRRRM